MTKIFICIFLYCYNYVFSTETFNYERNKIFGFGRNVVSMNNYEYPDPLPSSTEVYVRPPYTSLYQGRRTVNDRRVYNRRFEYSASSEGHKLHCEIMFQCIITHMAIKTVGNKPVILRGGVGYKHFSLMVCAEPGDQLSAHLEVYCARPKRA